MSKNLRDRAASILQKLRNISGERRENFDNVLATFAHERLIYRLSVSVHCDKFALKGGMLIRVLDVSTGRFTRDVDFLALGYANSEELKAMFEEILSLNANDGLVFDIKRITVTEIMKNQPYSGRHLSTIAYLGKNRIQIKIDIGFNDTLIDPTHEVEYQSMIDLESAKLRAYPTAKIIAEKFHAVVHLGLINTRMKDFYDLWTIPKAVSINERELVDAIRITFKDRRTQIPSSRPVALTNAFAHDPEKIGQWLGYLQTVHHEEIKLSEVVDEIWKRLEAPCAAALNSEQR